MDTMIQILLNYGTVGLVLAAFTESFLSPIPPALRRFVAPRYLDKLYCVMEKYGSFAIFLGALVPIPYKFNPCPKNGALFRLTPLPTVRWSR